MRVFALVVMVALAACERERAAPGPPPPPPPGPHELDPVTAARAEFDLANPELRRGTSKVYSRADFLPQGPVDDAAYDVGDFLGRARTLFGPPNVAGEGSYVLRHKRTGLLVTLDAAHDRPSYGGVVVEHPLTKETLGAWEATVSADPILAQGPPIPGNSDTSGNANAYWAAERAYRRRLADMRAGPALAGAIARVDALLSAVKPSDWETTVFDAEDVWVRHVGARDGESFAEVVEPVPAIEWLLARASSAANAEDQAFYDNAVLQYMRASPELVGYRARALPSLARFEAAAAAEPDASLRAELLRQAREARNALR